jgi:hypothetical protein
MTVRRVPNKYAVNENIARDHRVRHGPVSIAFFCADHQQALARRLALNDDLCDDQYPCHKAHGHAED